jgi:hypothetical protein
MEDRYFTTMCIPEAQPVGAKITTQNEPWVFALDVAQCFFITDSKKPSRVVVRRGKRCIIGLDGVANEEDFDQHGVAKKEEDAPDEECIPRRRRTMLPTGRPFKRKGHDVELKYKSKLKKPRSLLRRLSNDVNRQNYYLTSFVCVTYALKECNNNYDPAPVRTYLM